MFSQCLSGHSGYISVRTSSSISGAPKTLVGYGTWVSTDYGLIKLTVQLVQDQFGTQMRNCLINL